MLCFYLHFNSVPAVVLLRDSFNTSNLLARDGSCRLPPGEAISNLDLPVPFCALHALSPYSGVFKPEPKGKPPCHFSL